MRCALSLCELLAEPRERSRVPLSTPSPPLVYSKYLKTLGCLFVAYSISIYNLPLCRVYFYHCTLNNKRATVYSTRYMPVNVGVGAVPVH